MLEQIDDKRFMIRLERTLYKAAEGSPRIMEMFSEGSEVPMCTHNQPVQQAFEAGRRYIAMLKFDQYSEEGVWDAESIVLFTGPFSTQVDAGTHLAMEKGTVPKTNNLYYEDGGWSYIEESFTTTSKFSETVYADEVTDGFYDEGGRGQIWLNWAEGLEQVTKQEKHFTVIPTNSLDLLPAFHDRSAMLTEGRAITDGEFASGARVCLVSKGFLGINGLYIGDKLPLSLVYSMYGQCWKWDSGDGFGGTFSPLNAEGELYEPFWEAEYEIVGTYDMPFNEEFKYCLDTGKGIKGDSIIIPAKSVEASDENNIAYYAPMNAWTTSFIIPNGTIEEFDKRLHEAVPEASKLVITYDDSGYGEVKESLNNARLSGLLLFLVALLAAMAVIVLLLYFFVVKEKKRTAIERSLGMTKNQCRVSLVSGLVIIALTASLLGSIAGAVLVEKADFSVGEQEEFDSEYSLEYSMWAKNQDAAELDLEVSTPWGVYIAAPLVLTVVILLLSVEMVDRSFRIEPIYLLSSKDE